MRQKQSAALVIPLVERRLRFPWLLYYGWGKPAHEAALNLPSGGVRRCFELYHGRLVCLYRYARFY